MPLDAGATLESEIAPSLQALEGLRNEWRELWTRSEATPFQSPGGLIAWAKHYAPDRAAAVVVREHGRLIGLLPLFDWQGALLLAGTGPTDYNDGVFAPGRNDAAALALARTCELADARGCDAVDLHQLRPESLLRQAAAPCGWAAETLDGDICPVAPVLGETGLGAMPGKWRRKLGYTRRRMEAQGGYTVELAADAAAARTFWEALERLHTKRWRAVGLPGVLSEDPLMRGFLADAVEGWLADGCLRLRVLRIDGEIAAALLCLQDARAAHMYLAGFDPDRMAQGPGTLLIAETIEGAAREGAAEIRFLRGEEPYKRHWGAAPAPTFRRVLRRG